MAARIPYIPRPGSVAEKALAYLQEEGTSSSRVLADALGQPVSAMWNLLEYAVRNGAIERNMKGGLLYWSVGDYLPKPREPEEPLLTRRGKLVEGPEIDKVLHGRPVCPACKRELEETKR